MVRIEILWDHISPFLKICSGIVKITEVTYNKELQHIDYNNLLEGKIIVEEHTLSLKDIKNDKEIFDKYHDTITRIAKNYFDGMCLKSETYIWIGKETNEKIFETDNP